MSSEFLTSTTISDHDVTLVIPGDLPSVRQRLVEAIKQVGYRVLEDQPLKAKRIKEGMSCGLNVVDYPTTLTVSLKQTNDVAVMATFSFEIKSYTRITRGDRHTLDREAEAMAALASERHAITACRSCGSRIDDESHFCRRCGAPLMIDVPELEIFRLTKGARGAYQHLGFGLFAFFLASLVALLMLLINTPKAWAALGLISASCGAYGLVLVIQGLFQLRQTLNPKPRSNILREPARVIASADTTALNPAQTPVSSITEGTTDLLIPAGNQRVPEPTRRRAPDTDEIEADGLM